MSTIAEMSFHAQRVIAIVGSFGIPLVWDS